MSAFLRLVPLFVIEFQASLRKLNSMRYIPESIMVVSNLLNSVNYVCQVKYNKDGKGGKK